MSSEQPRQGQRGPPAESYGPAPGQTTSTQAFHSTDMNQTQGEVPRSPQPQGGIGYRGQGSIQSQEAGYQTGVQSLQAGETSYTSNATALNAQVAGLSQQRTGVESSVSLLQQNEATYNTQQANYEAGVSSFNAQFGGKSLTPSQYSTALIEEGVLMQQRNQLETEQSSLLSEQATVSGQVNAFNANVANVNTQSAALGSQYAGLQKQAAALNIEAMGINAEVSSANARVQNPSSGPKPTGIFGDIEIGAATVYGAFNTGAKDVLTAVGTGGREIGALAVTGKLEPPSQATAQYLYESPLGVLPTGQTVSGAGATILAYDVPGFAIVKGVGEYNASGYQRAFDIGVGALSIAPIVGSAAGLTEAGSAGAGALSTLGNPAVRTGLGAGLSATGAAISGGNPQQIGEAAVIGGGFSYFGGEFAQGIGGRINAAATAGAEAAQLENVGLVRIGTEPGADVVATPQQAQNLGLEVGTPSAAFPSKAPFIGPGQVAIGSTEETVYASVEQAQNLGIGSGPTFTQRLALAFTGGVELPPVPAGGAGLERIMGIGSRGEPLGIPPGANATGQGLETDLPVETQPPVDLANLVQDFEGPSPTKNIPTGGQIGPTQEMIDYGVSPFKEPIGGSTTGRPLTGGDFGIQTIQKETQGNVGPSGGGGAGPGYTGNYGGGGGVTETTFSYPQNASVPQGPRLAALSAGGYPTGAEAFSIGQGYPQVGDFASYLGTPQRTGFEAGVQQAQSQQQQQAQIPSVSFATQQQQATGQSSISLQSFSLQQQQGQSQIAIEESGFFGAFPEPVTSRGQPYPFPGFSLRTPIPDKRLQGSKKNSYAFGLNKNPVGNLLTLGTKAEKFDL